MEWAIHIFSCWAEGNREIFTILINVCICIHNINKHFSHYYILRNSLFFYYSSWSHRRGKRTSVSLFIWAHTSLIDLVPHCIFTVHYGNKKLNTEETIMIIPMNIKRRNDTFSLLLIGTDWTQDIAWIKRVNFFLNIICVNISTINEILLVVFLSNIEQYLSLSFAAFSVRFHGKCLLLRIQYTVYVFNIHWT